MHENLAFLRNHFLSILPPAPPSPKRAAKYYQAPPRLLFQPHGGEPHIVGPEDIHWIDHQIFGDVCATYFTAFHHDYPQCLNSTFMPTGFNFIAYTIDGVEMYCETCQQYTYVDNSWFYSMIFNAGKIHCCTKNYTKAPYLRSLFWNIAFYNAATILLASCGHEVALVLGNTMQWRWPGHGKPHNGRWFGGASYEEFENDVPPLSPELAALHIPWPDPLAPYQSMLNAWIHE